ncbi:hypothetical protein C0Q70_02100 [Pomacea canaliculata]|uniref:sphinganine-1-phosphate aldolase n=1 Tax=Pomacea canaliculata TaxID=400727 RepID=A0A2T7Q1C0_POMCA|nr:hypothetical protein C0Q70_02100 [Pomacea canaliculata]
MNKSIKGSNYLRNLPLKGFTEEEVLGMLQQYKQLAKDDWKKGKVSGTVYSGEDKLTELMAKTTSGGTESIMLACLAYRNIARSRGIKVPEIIVPHTAHAAFDKAASFFHMKITHIPVDEVTCKVDVAAMKRAISRETCMLVVSAPSFPHGIIDPVEEVAELGRKYNVPVHVDCCLGGFLVPFMEKAGYSLAPFDFRVLGVTSISADTHKYGFAPKGSSVIMYRNSALHKQQFFVQPDWPGGIYASPTMAGYRAGAIIAACWATMLYFGEQGYINSTRAIVSTTKYITDELKKVDGIFVYGSPEVCVIGIGSKHFNIYRLFEDLVGKGWIINSLQFPASIHLCVTMPTTQSGVADQFVNDVRTAVEEIMKTPSKDCEGVGAIYGMVQTYQTVLWWRRLQAAFWSHATIPRMYLILVGNQ